MKYLGIMLVGILFGMILLNTWNAQERTECHQASKLLEESEKEYPQPEWLKDQCAYWGITIN